MSGASSRTKECSRDEWERIRRPFRDLYLKQNMTLPVVRQILKHEYHFDATEKQYKNKIRLWGWRKNATLEEYSLVDQWLQSPSRPLGDAIISQGIPLTDKKIRRYLRNKGNKARGTIKGEISPSPHRTEGPSAMPLLADNEAGHSWSPSIADERRSEPDKRCSSSRLTELCRELTEKEAHMGELEHQIADLRRLIHSGTATSKLPQKDTAGLQDILSWRRHTGPRQSTKQQPRAQLSYLHTSAGQPAEEIRNRTPTQQATMETEAPLVPASEMLPMREPNTRGECTVPIRNPQLQSYQQEHNYVAHAQRDTDNAIFSPGPPWENSGGDDAKPLLAAPVNAELGSMIAFPGLAGNESDDPFQALEHVSLDEWMSPAATVTSISGRWASSQEGADWRERPSKRRDGHPRRRLSSNRASVKRT